MKKILFIVLIIPAIIKAQSTKQYIYRVDSTEYYEAKLRHLWKNNYDSFTKSQPFISLRDSVIAFIQTRNDYTGLVLYNDFLHSDYSAFNKLIAQNGFPPLGTISYRMGIGIAHKRGHTIIDMYFGTIGFYNGTSTSNATIHASLSNLLQLDIGYDVLNSERVSIYPFAGLSGRFSELYYSKGGGDNPSYTDITNIRADQNELSMESSRLGYQYGIGFDYAFSYNRVKTYKSIVFLKAGVNKPFKEDIYKDINGSTNTYNPGIKQGDWLLSIGIKFANKR